MEIRSGVYLVAGLPEGNQKILAPGLASRMVASEDVVSVLVGVGAGWAFVLLILFPPADVVVGG